MSLPVFSLDGDDIESDFLIRAQLDKEFICKLSELVQAAQLAVLATCSSEVTTLRSETALPELSVDLLAANQPLIALARLSVRTV